MYHIKGALPLFQLKTQKGATLSRNTRSRTNVVHVAICSTFWSVTVVKNFKTKMDSTKIVSYLTISDELDIDLSLIGKLSVRAFQ